MPAETLINLAFVTDRNFFDYTIITIYSIIDHSTAHFKANMNHSWREYSRKALGFFQYQDFSVINIFVKLRKKAKFLLSYNKA